MFQIGPALGPSAVPHVCRFLPAAGYAPLQAHSEWVIDGASAPTMQAAMIDRMPAAAIEQEPGATNTVLDWKA